MVLGVELIVVELAGKRPEWSQQKKARIASKNVSVLHPLVRLIHVFETLLTVNPLL